MSQLFAELTVVNLQQVGNPLIDEISWVEVQRDTLYIRAGSQMYLADRNGKIIGAIGKKGEGPGEFKHFRDALVNPLGKIEILADNKIITYSPTNVATNEQRIDSLPQYFAKWNNRYFFHFGNNKYQNADALVATDAMATKRTHAWLPIDAHRAKYLNLKASNCFSVVNDTLVVMQPFCDTIYQIDRGMHLSGRYVIDFGDRNLSPVLFAKPYRHVKEFLDAVRAEARYCLLVNGFIENKRVVSFSFEYRTRRYQFYWDKASGRQWLAQGHYEDLGNSGLGFPPDYEHSPVGYDEDGVFFAVEAAEWIAAAESAKGQASPLIKQIGIEKINPQNNPLLIYAKFKSK